MGTQMAEITCNTDVINLAILEDHLGVIDGYMYRLQSEKKLRITGLAMFGEDLLPMLAKHPVNVLILDIEVPTSRTNPNHFPVVAMIPDLIRKYPRLIILVISSHSQVVMVDRLMELGVRGFVAKADSEAILRLPEIILALAGGGTYIGQGTFEMGLNAGVVASSKNKQLTVRQMEVLSMFVSFPDATSCEIAQKMNITASTVRNSLSSAYARLEVHTLAAAIAKMQRLGLLGTASLDWQLKNK